MALGQQQKTAIDVTGADLGAVIIIDIDANTQVTGCLTGLTLSRWSDVEIITYDRQVVKRSAPTATLVIDKVGTITMPGDTPVSVLH